MIFILLEAANAEIGRSHLSLLALLPTQQMIDDLDGGDFNSVNDVGNL